MRKKLKKFLKSNHFRGKYELVQVNALGIIPDCNNRGKDQKVLTLFVLNISYKRFTVKIMGLSNYYCNLAIGKKVYSLENQDNDCRPHIVSMFLLCAGVAGITIML